jgi:hypothetical protein
MSCQHGWSHAYTPCPYCDAASCDRYVTNAATQQANLAEQGQHAIYPQGHHYQQQMQAQWNGLSPQQLQYQLLDKMNEILERLDRMEIRIDVITTGPKPE